MPGSACSSRCAQVIESVNWTFKGQLDPERHGGKTPEGILARVLVLTAAAQHHDKTSQPVKRSLAAHDH
ncbi:MAG: transposase [Actinomycetia bacterium]|nr:transposase [Actinomycetes bacterium]